MKTYIKFLSLLRLRLSCQLRLSSQDKSAPQNNYKAIQINKIQQTSINTQNQTNIQINTNQYKSIKFNKHQHKKSKHIQINTNQ